MKEHDHWATQALKAKRKTEELSKEIGKLKAKKNGSSPNAVDADKDSGRILELTREQMAEEKDMKDDNDKAANALNAANLQIKVLTAQEVTSGFDAQKNASLAAEAQKKAEGKIKQIAPGAIDTLQKNAQGQIQATKTRRTQYVAEQGDTDRQIQQAQLKEDREHKKCAESWSPPKRHWTTSPRSRRCDEEEYTDAWNGPEGNRPCWAETGQQTGWGEIKRGAKGPEGRSK